jgi:diguanylate cyclase (GGDEF)-like protein
MCFSPGRWGGEQFVAIIANTHLLVLEDVAERLRLLVAASAARSQEIRVTISVGGADATKNDTLESLFRRADDKLYEAKNFGRNCIRI